MSGGTISVSDGSKSTKGVLKVGDGLSVTEGTVSADVRTASVDPKFTSGTNVADIVINGTTKSVNVPQMSTSQVGMAKVGTGLKMDTTSGNTDKLRLDSPANAAFLGTDANGQLVSVALSSQVQLVRVNLLDQRPYARSFSWELQKPNGKSDSDPITFGDLPIEISVINVNSDPSTPNRFIGGSFDISSQIPNGYNAIGCIGVDTSNSDDEGVVGLYAWREHYVFMKNGLAYVRVVGACISPGTMYLRAWILCAKS